MDENSVEPSEEQLFCMFCGTKLPQMENEVVYCPKCGRSRHDGKVATHSRTAKQINRNIKFCIYCGTLLDTHSYHAGTCRSCDKLIPSP
ncbi:hypothetical protein GF325_14505 [Candidatus Bathyarchaeota archaeon]|nr:hypothetical protein [Candidatus Bathyarchaeota archaeon]